MKKMYFLSAVLLSAFALNAQSLTPTVIASTGGFSSNAAGSLSYTVGEMTMVQTFSAGGNILTQGFQQPNDFVSGLLDITQEAFGSFVVYPNPAIDNMWFGFTFPEAGKVEATVYDNLGQRIANVYNGNYNNGKTVEQLNVSNYATGMYYLTVNFVSNKDGKQHSISKKFQVIN